ncbi:glycosyltransferase family 4 protein [Compostibacter hankyongensis]|uniref:Glycosyltransferase n=1 Tax=Compostibacter hankyongensis TaxID=1007089 RepID=A0ABP8FNJ0_9BACT
MKIAYIASFPPRECGIATFTQNLVRAIGLHVQADTPQDTATIIAMNDPGSNYAYPHGVGFVIRQEIREDYYRAADFINTSGAGICVLEHEFGIFGGESGVYILSLLSRLKIPFVVTFHTVLKSPSFLQKMVIREIAKRASGVVIMSRKAVTFLDNIYEVPAEKIHLIEHGVPDMRPQELPEGEDLLQPYKGRRILFTFGLLNRNKGVETVIRALPEIVDRHPEVVYLVLGNTHPGVVRSSGEEYREYLKQLIAELGMEKHVFFINRFVTEAQLAYYLSSIDIYITPYLNEAQITSGTLSYAVGAGAAVLSTPYWHATELLADGRGMLFNFKDHRQLAAEVNMLLDTPSRLEGLQKKALEYGKKLGWSRIGKQYLQLFRHILEEQMLSPVGEETPLLAEGAFKEGLPPFSLAHVLRLTDDTGILQHAKFGIPNLKEGYCLDDNARALILALMAFRHHKSHEALKLLPVYLGFVHYMQRDDGLFRNFLLFNREYTEEIGSEDAFGRAVWALGYLIRYAPNSAYREFGLEIFRRTIPHFSNLQHLRGISNTIIGISHYLASFPTDEGMIGHLSRLAGKLMNAYHAHAADGWQWFEDRMIYDNGILPLALLHAYEITADAAMKQTALATLHFLEKICFRNGCFAPVGNNGWYLRGGDIPLFDQQAIETMAMVLLYERAYQTTGKTAYLGKMYDCHAWFLGENELHIPLYDHETHGCCDGLQEQGINRNQGAESTLAYWISGLTVRNALESGTGQPYHSALQQKEVLL